MKRNKVREQNKKEFIFNNKLKLAENKGLYKNVYSDSEDEKYEQGLYRHQVAESVLFVKSNFLEIKLGKQYNNEYLLTHAQLVTKSRNTRQS